MMKYCLVFVLLCFLCVYSQKLPAVAEDEEEESSFSNTISLAMEAMYLIGGNLQTELIEIDREMQYITDKWIKLEERHTSYKQVAELLLRLKEAST